MAVARNAARNQTRAVWAGNGTLSALRYADRSAVAQSTVTITFCRRGAERTADVQTSAGTYQIQLPSTIPYEYSEFSRLLRWKAIGLHDPGDTLLIDVGRPLSHLLFPAAQQRYWTDLTVPEQRLVVTRFADPTDDYQSLPWELLYIGGAFLLQVPGCHLLRDYGVADAAQRCGFDAGQYNARSLQTSIARVTRALKSSAWGLSSSSA